MGDVMDSTLIHINKGIEDRGRHQRGLILLKHDYSGDMHVYGLI